MANISLRVLCIQTLLVLAALKATECIIERAPSSNSNIQDGAKGVFDIDDHNSTSDAVDKLTDSIIDVLEEEDLDNRERHQNNKRSRRVDKTRGRNSREKFDWTRDNFVVTDNLPDGENEKRIKLGKISAKETSVGKNGKGLVLRQLTDGLNFVQTISNMAGEMVDCEYIQDSGMVRKFLRDFRNEIKSNFIQINTRKWKDRFESEPSKYDDDDNNNGGIDDTGLKGDLQNDEAIYRDDFKLAFGKIRPKRGLPKPDLDDYYFDTAENWAKFDSDSRFEKRKLKKKRKFLKSRIGGLRNVTVLRLGGRSDLPRDIAEWLNLKTLEKRCDNVQENLKQALGLDGDEGLQMQDSNTLQRSTSRSKRSILIAPGMLWCGAGQLARSPRELGELGAPDACCRAHDLCGGGVPGLGRKNGLVNFRPFTVSRCSCDRSGRPRAGGDGRAGRRARAAGMLVPGTRWCGRGGAGGRHAELGAFSGADRCCRSHDTACPFWIGAAETKYGVFNWRPNTLMHCRCDERFRACLKLADTDAANMVGKLFFNVVQTKCFVLKPAKVCLQRSWWGKCLKTGYTKQAHLRQNPGF